MAMSSVDQNNFDISRPTFKFPLPSSEFIYSLHIVLAGVLAAFSFVA
jgi:hypothetical protein